MDRGLENGYLGDCVGRVGFTCSHVQPEGRRDSAPRSELCGLENPPFPFMEDGRNCPSPLPLSLYYPFFPFLFTTEWAARMSIVWSRFSLAYSSPQLPLYRSCVRGAPAVGLVPSLRTELIYTLVTCCVIALFIRQNHLR